ncbi:MAG: GDSL-type esterase/lipase family protein [Nitrospirota bacterium]|nr:GDSL-type esterase/lipase family protein [Nitrospirota bacterium]
MGNPLPRRSLQAFSLVLLIASTSLSVAVAEGIARFFIQLPQERIYPQVRYQAHAVRGFTLRPNQVAYTKDQAATIDTLGFRTSSMPVTTGMASFRILALGDSFTFGYGVADHETWPSVLERRLGSTFQVINAGTTSYSVFHELDLLKEKGLGLKPRVVIHGLYWNDHMMNHPPRPTDPPLLTADGHFAWDGDDNPASDAPWLRAVRWLRNHSVLANSALTQARRYFTPPDSGVHLYDVEYQKFLAGQLVPEAWQAVDDFYRDIKQLGEESGFNVYVVIFPVRDIIAMPDPANHVYPRFIRELLDRHGIPYFDGFALWQQAHLGVDLFLPYDEHLTAEGYRIISDGVAANLCSGALRERFREPLPC